MTTEERVKLLKEAYSIIRDEACYDSSMSSGDWGECSSLHDLADKLWEYLIAVKGGKNEYNA